MKTRTGIRREEVLTGSTTYTPDESFIALWEEYITAQGLEREYEEYIDGAKFCGLISGPIAARWLRYQAACLDQAAL